MLVADRGNYELIDTIDSMTSDPEMFQGITDLSYASLGGKTNIATAYIIMVIGITNGATTSYIYK